MVSSPVVMPLTIPADRVALGLAILQVPPEAVSERVMVLPLQTSDGPVMVAGLGKGLMTILCSIVIVPQALVTR